jgi:hypothetical protein
LRGSAHFAARTVQDLNVFAVVATQAGLAIDRARPREEEVEQPQPSAAIE